MTVVNLHGARDETSMGLAIANGHYHRPANEDGAFVPWSPARKLVILLGGTVLSWALVMTLIYGLLQLT